MKKFNSELEVYEEMARYENKTIGDIAGESGNLSSKAYVGHIIEEKIFGYKPNSKSAPDLENLDLEIKSTPVKKVNQRYVSKERLVLNIINYCNENWESIYESSFWRKNRNLLIVFYEYFFDNNPSNFKILKSIIYKYPEEDFRLILNDWIIIANKVKDGKAHELSERDTLYLAACTKGANSESVQKQPFSTVMAKRRAYSFKSSYMTTVFNDYVLNQKVNERIINNLDISFGDFNLQEHVNRIFQPYLGKKTSELINLLNININNAPKSLNSIIINKILGIKNSVENIDEFKKAGIIPKTIRVELNGAIKESMSFPTFKFKEIIKENWEESELYNLLSTQQFLLIIFQKVNNENEYKLVKTLFWFMPEEDIEQCRLVWEKTKQIIIEGVKINRNGSRNINNLPKQKDNIVMHVRPHAQNKDDTYELPDGRYLTKQCFWLNNTYLKGKIS